MSKQKLLIIDDEESIRKQLRWALDQYYDISLAGDRKEALTIVHREKPCVVTLDMGLPPHPAGAKEGFKCLEDMLEIDPHVKVIVITGNQDKANALKAVSIGAYDYYTKPIEIDELKVILKRAFNLSELERENVKLQKIERGELEGIIGSSEVMKEVFATIEKIAVADIPVLIIGESGTGKELVASAIHSLGKRNKGPFVPINCAAIPENLVESELFGHEKGAFTGAAYRKKGKIEHANKGILFLDEIGDIHPNLQVKLLRFLQDHKIERVGGTQSMDIDTRIIAATNRDIKTAISEGNFRDDLYYRLSAVTIELPPLRDRGDDILHLARVFLSKYSSENKKRFKGFTLGAILVIQTYQWPGNVRELENKIKRAVVMARGPMITPEDLTLEVSEDQSLEKDDGLNIKKAKDRLEAEFIKSALLKNKNNFVSTAQELGVSRTTFYYLMKKHGIDSKPTT
ncbi:MAG: PEP-CTERM-box response regulator transcription factor [Thermodesulfobacteriota bacterium]